VVGGYAKLPDRLRRSLNQKSYKETPVFTIAILITNGLWICEAFEQIMTLSSIREYQGSWIDQPGSINLGEYVPSIRMYYYTYSLTIYKSSNQAKNKTMYSNKHEEKERSTSMIYITYF